MVYALNGYLSIYLEDLSMLKYSKPEGPENGRKITPQLKSYRKQVKLKIDKADLPTLKFVFGIISGHSQKKLTYNDKRFLLRFIESGDANQAYREVYNKKNAQGKQKLNRLSAKLGPGLEDSLFRKNFQLTKDWVLNKMKESFEMAKTSEDLTNLNRTLENFAKILKMFPTKHEVKFTSDGERLSFFRRLEDRFNSN